MYVLCNNEPNGNFFHQMLSKNMALYPLYCSAVYRCTAAMSQ